MYTVYEILFKHNQDGKYVVEKTGTNKKKNALVHICSLFSGFQQN